MLLIAIALLLGVAPVPVRALDQGVLVQMMVRDDLGKAIDGARLVLIPNSGNPLVCVSDTAGKCTVSNVLPGYYRLRITRVGFISATQSVEVTLETESLDLDVKLMHELITVARVQSRVAVSEHTFAQNKGFGRVFVSLADLMNALGNAKVVVSKGSLVGVSLEGRDPSLTETSFNGVSIQSAAALSAIGIDALSRARSDDDDIAIDLSTLGPAPYPVYEAQAVVGGDGMQKTKSTAQGTSGAIGYAVAAVYHRESTPLSGQTYADTSGFTYKHLSALSGPTFDARTDISLASDWTLMIETLRHSSSENALSALYTGGLPVGYGPGKNPQVLRGSTTSVGLTGSLGAWSLNASFNQFNSNEVDDFGENYVGRALVSYAQVQSGYESDLHLFGVRGLARNGSLNLNLNVSRGFFSNILVPSDNQVGSSVGSASTRVLADASYAWRTDTGRYYQVMVSQAASMSPVVQRNSRLDLRGSQRLAAGDVFADAAWGSKLGEIPNPGQFTPPSQAVFDCAAGTVVGGAPSDLPSSPTDQSYRLGYDYTSRSTSFSIQGYWERYRGIQLTGALVDLRSEPASVIPADYEQGLVDSYNAVGGCTGTPRAIYLQQDLAGQGVDYHGVEIAVGHHFGNRLSLQAQVSLRNAILRSADLRLGGSASPYMVGRELPNSPHVSASGSVEFRASSAVDFLGNASIVGSNNIANLPAYSLVTMGAVVRLSSQTSVSLISTNATRQFASAFTSPRFAVPLPTVGGGTFETLAVPLVQPLFYIALDFRWEHDPNESK